MCFSAPASLAASGVLGISGIAILRMPKKKTEIPLSLFPIIFAVHQLVEGILWLSLTGVISDTYKAGAVYAYAFIAFVFWPIFVPFSMYMVETGRMRRKLIILCQLVGLYIGISFLISLVQGPVDATALSHSISYQIKGPAKSLAPYLIAVSVPLLLASNKRLVILGAALLLSCGAAAYMACSNTFPSVWCFYAAIMSLIIYLYFRYQAKATTKKEKMKLQQST
ncbi:MAG: DUF6629 family protein [Dehalococcoidia bacterium]|jgi:hypothetical protein